MIRRTMRRIQWSRFHAHFTATPFFGAWFLMIGVGIWHSSQPSIPPIGYLPSLLILAGLSAINTHDELNPPGVRR